MGSLGGTEVVGVWEDSDDFDAVVGEVSGAEWVAEGVKNESRLSRRDEDGLGRDSHPESEGSSVELAGVWSHPKADSRVVNFALVKMLVVVVNLEHEEGRGALLEEREADILRQTVEVPSDGPASDESCGAGIHGAEARLLPIEASLRTPRPLAHIPHAVIEQDVVNVRLRFRGEQHLELKLQLPISAFE